MASRRSFVVGHSRLLLGPLCQRLASSDKRPTTIHPRLFIIPFISASTKTRSSPSVHKATDVRLGRIVRLLMDHATVVVSGTKIAEEIGTTRSEVWRLIQQLRAAGVDVAGRPATGYQLRAVPDLLLPEMLAPSLKGTIFGNARHIHHYYKIGSTNFEAMRAAAQDAPQGSVFLAEEQLAGRGRGAHTWHSERSTGIYCSVVLRPALPPSDALIFSLAAGLAVRAALVEIAPQILADLKWPNDLLLGDKKFCGILTEMNAEATRVRYLVVGIGINVNQVKFPAELNEIATSLRIETGTEWSRMELCAALLKSLDREYRGLVEDAGPRNAIIRRFEEASSSVRGREVSIDENEHLSGVTEGLDESGFLRLRTKEGLRTVVSGMVRIDNPVI
jgi:BirA family transcriptional regulator, biotin operon repressor / biotin---[acetyl-CoA-carboxylase] ligase